MPDTVKLPSHVYELYHQLRNLQMRQEQARPDDHFEPMEIVAEGEHDQANPVDKESIGSIPLVQHTKTSHARAQDILFIPRPDIAGESSREPRKTFFLGASSPLAYYQKYLEQQKNAHIREPSNIGHGDMTLGEGKLSLSGDNQRVQLPTPSIALLFYNTYIACIEVFLPLIGSSLSHVDVARLCAMEKCGSDPSATVSEHEKLVLLHVVITIGLRLRVNASDEGIHGAHGRWWKKQLLLLRTAELYERVAMRQYQQLQSRWSCAKMSMRERTFSVRILLLMVILDLMDPTKGNTWQILTFAAILSRQSSTNEDHIDAEILEQWYLLQRSLKCLELVVGLALGRCGVLAAPELPGHEQYSNV